MRPIAPLTLVLALIDKGCRIGGPPGLTADTGTFWRVATLVHFASSSQLHPVFPSSWPQVVTLADMITSLAGAHSRGCLS